ncbi:uncharacterized protein PF3D7_1120600-like [Polyergus mexicanus]|uniref:uncharacterized protein PF3D7_1120600-like n=1 Tax=Polyergus mexicanus TaxID=615972 RepID=UPI0038B50FCD
MKQVARSFLPSLFCLRMCFLLYVTFAIISTPAEINKRNGNKMTYTKEEFDSIKNLKKSTILPQQRGNNKVDIRNRNANESATISDKKSSAALNRFLEDVLKARNDLKWIDHVTPRVNHITRLDDSGEYTKCRHSTVSVDTENVLESADIGYRNRLRGKRGFDRNYERMWMLQKKKYGEENTPDIPQRVYLDNDMTFKREADNADFDMFYPSPYMLDRSVYEGGAIADQPLKDWARKKDLHSSGDWSNSNENPKVTNGESTWLRDYNSARELLANSDLNKDEEKLHDDDTGNQLKVISLYNPMRADDFSVLQKSSPIRNRKSQNTPLTLESLKKIVLDLRNNLTISNKKENVLSKESSWWDHQPGSSAKIFNFERDLDEHPYKETIWRINRGKNVSSEDESDPRISQGAELRELYLGEQNLKELHDRCKRSRRSFIADLNNQKDVPENKSHREARIIKDALGNVTRMQKSKGVVARLYSDYLDNDGKSLTRTLSKINISDSQYSLDKRFFLNHRFINLTIISSVPDKVNISELRYLSITEPNLNNYSIYNTSLFLVKIDLQTHSPKHIATNKVLKINSKKLDRHSLTEKIPKNIDDTAEEHTISLDFGKKFAVLNTSVDSIRFSTNSNADDSRKFAGKRISDEKKLSAWKKSRLDTDDGQSKDARAEFPQGNTSRGFDTAANESRRIHGVETIAATKREEIETNGTRKENRELISGVIKVFEPRERSYQKQKAEARLLRRMREDGRTNDSDESTDANAREVSSSSIDLVIDATVKLEVASVNASGIGESIIRKDQREDLVSMTVDNDLRKQQQMVPSLSATTSSANKLNGNSDTDRIDIRVVGSNGNETMNVKEGTQTVTEAREYHESDNHLRRRLLWISVDTEIEDSLIKSTELVLNSTIESRIEDVMDKDRQQSKIINSADSGEILITVKRDDNAEENFALQNNCNLQMSDANHHARYKRSTYSFENLESNNAAENVEVGKEVAVNHDEKEENNEEYKNVERVKGNYSDSEEDVMEDNDRAMESERRGRISSRHRIDPARAKIDMLIKQKLEKRKKNKDSDYRRKKRSMLDMIEYYDYDDNNEEQESDARINEQGIRNKNNEFLIEDERSEMKREDKTTCKPSDLGKKKNENAEAVMKEEREKAKNKEPKEQIIIDLGERKNKTLKNDQKDKKPSGASESSLGDALSKGKQLSTEKNSGKIRQSEDYRNNIYGEKSTDLKPKWLDQSFENGMALPKNSEVALNDNRRKNPDVIENILLDIQPIKILEQSRELEAWKNFYQDFENERPEDYYYQGKDRSYPNDVESLYEELKNVYDWTDGELKSGPRLRGDQRLRYESDNKLDTNPSQLQPLDDRFFSSIQNDDEERNFQLFNTSWTNSNTTTTSNYLALKVTDNIFKDGLEQSSFTKENLSQIFSVGTESSVSKVRIIQNNPFLKRSATGQSRINIDSGSPYENRKYIESETRKVLKRNVNSEKQAAINSQDLDESFVESLDWHDDFDDNDVKVRLGRGLKAVDEAIISGSNKTHDQDNKLDMTNITNINSKLYNSSQIFRDNSSISHDWYNNITADLINVFNVHRDTSEWSTKKIQEPILTNTIYIMDDDEDLEAAEQKYVNNQTRRVRRAAASYRTFYDDVSGNQGNSYEADKTLSDHFQLSNILEDQSDGVYNEYAATNLNNDIQDFDRYSQIPRIDSRKRENSKKKSKKNKQSTRKHAKKHNSHPSSSRNKRHHTHRSDVSRNANRDNLKPKKKSKVKASSLTGRTRIQKSKTAEQGLLRRGVNEEAPSEKVLYENAEDRSTVKPEEGNARRKEITLLLAADNVDDESQIDVALHGELAGKIVEQIFEQIQNNDQLKNVFGPGLRRNYKTEDVITASDIYRQKLDENETNHTETMMKRIKELLGKLILNEVQRKTCVSLSPNMREFLGWMLEVDREEEPLEEVPPLPLIRQEMIPEQNLGHKFLFYNTSKGEDINDLQKKVKVLDTLVKEYNALTAKEKTRVQTVHDYLIRQLNLLLRYIEERERKGKLASVSIEAARAGTGNILRYQSAMPNVTNANYSMTKDAFSLPIDTSHNFFRETRSLEIPSKQYRKTKRQKFRNYKKNENNRKTKRKHRKHRSNHNRAGSSPGYKKSRQKRASHEGRDSLYLGYEEPTIYDSFDLLDARLTEKKKKKKKKKKRERELADKKNMTENDRMLNLLPIKGKNRLEDEVILLNKREAWRKENEEQLEEVAFGKDMRNGTRREKERFEKLMEGDKHKPIDETSSRTKREDIIRVTSTIRNTDRFDKSHSVSEASSDKTGKISRASYDNSDNGAKDTDKLKLVEDKINVFADNKTNAAIDTATAEVSTREKLVVNAGANNQVKGKLCAINRETKIDRTNGSTSFANLTSDANIGVSKERQKVSAAEKEANDNAVKLNRAANYRSEEIDPEIELKNLRREGREKGIYGVADWRMIDLFYDDDDDDNLSRNKLREKYVAKSDGPSDLDPENNLELPRLRNNKWSNDVVEWKLLPVIKSSPHYDDRALSRVRLIEKKTPISNNIKNVEIEPNAYLNSGEFRRLKHRRRRNGEIFHISPVLRIIDDDDSFSRKIRWKTKRASEIAESKDSRVNPKISLKSRKLPRLRNNKRWNDVAEFEVPFAPKDYNRKLSLREISRSRNDPELDDRLIYNEVGLRLPVRSYRYYDDYEDSPTFHFVPNILRRDDDAYRYPAGAYLEYGPFKERIRDSNRRLASRKRFRLKTSGEEVVDFPADNLASKTSKSSPVHGKFLVQTDEPALASRKNYFSYSKTKCTRKTRESNETKSKEQANLLNNKKI